MLLQFAVENYLSFRDRAVLSMLADPRVEHEAGQVLVAPGGREVVRAAAVYGANGSGKSNLIKALDAVREMVLKGTRGEERLPVVPFKLDPAKQNEPAHFEMELVGGDTHYSYGFEVTAKQVEAESLYENNPSGEERLRLRARSRERQARHYHGGSAQRGCAAARVPRVCRRRHATESALPRRGR